MERLSLKEQHVLLLELAKDVTSILNRHGIPYYMLGGTMLGAIRHKGFIPWDDDMDFGIPLPYYQQAKNVLDKELKKRYRCSTYKETKGNHAPFLKVDDTSTVIHDIKLSIPLEDQLGLNIDLFPLVECDLYSWRLLFFFLLRKINRIVFTNSTSTSVFKARLKKLIRLFFPFSQERILDYLWKQVTLLPPGDYIGNVFGAWGKREIITKTIMGEPVEYVFEDTFLGGAQKYDDYLKMLYGDYMNLPKIEERKPHCNVVYYRDYDRE